jgi:cytochrome c2
VHALQHTSFLAAACLFWWALVHGRYGRLAYGMSVLYVFATTVYSGVLGALVTFAPRLWYPIYVRRTSQWGLSPLEDQQLAGLLMWVPSGVIFIVLGLALFAAWLGEAERRVGYREDGETGGGRREAIGPRRGFGIVSSIAVAVLLFGAGCQRSEASKARALTGGDPDRGKQVIPTYGCESCHTIPGVPGARGLVGPSLEKVGNRVYIAGHLQNTPGNLIAWIRNPQRMHFQTAMPQMGVTERDGRDIAAYLYTLK